MQTQDTWFAVFGTEGAEFVRGIINSILGITLILILLLSIVKSFHILGKMKLSDDEDKIIIYKSELRRALIGFGLGALSTSLMILILNIIPRQSESITDSSWFDVFSGDTKGDIKNMVNWIIAALTGIIIILFLITTPHKIIKWMIADEDDIHVKRKGIFRNVVILIVALSIVLIFLVIINITGNPAKI